MDPNKFRESRLSINKKYDKIDELIEAKAFEESMNNFEKVSADLESLRPEAEGEIQKRSVKNLGMRLNHLDKQISKLKTKRTGTAKKGGAKSSIVWDEERVAQLAKSYLEKLVSNMQGDANALVKLGTTGKGIRPNYRIEYTDGRVQGFTGSGHKPQKEQPKSDGKNLSNAFPCQVVTAILEEK